MQRSTVPSAARPSAASLDVFAAQTFEAPTTQPTRVHLLAHYGPKTLFKSWNKPHRSVTNADVLVYDESPRVHVR